MKLRYIGKSGQVKKGALVETIEKIEGYTRGRAVASNSDSIFLFKDTDLEPAYIYSTDLPAGFLDALNGEREKVTTRVLWPNKKDRLVQETFQENGLTLPPDARPLNNKQWDWSAEMRFPVLPENLVPEGTITKDGWMWNSRRDIVLAILKAGFPLTAYAKYTEAQ